MQNHYQDIYTRKIDLTPIESYIKVDLEWKIQYIEDFRCTDRYPLSVIREVNLKFLKILAVCGVCNVTTNGLLTWKPFLTLEDIKKIINVIEQAYIQDKFVDTDLHDDVFEHFDIVSPIKAYYQTSRQHFIQKNEENFANLKECENFLKDRSKLFCLYIFLRRCAILYRDTAHKKPLEMLLNCLSNKDNLKKFKSEQLRVDSIQFSEDYWGTGLHEWLTCEFVLLALRRTAGLTPSESCIKAVEGTVSLKGNSASNFIFSEFNWLDFQFLIRTPTNFIIFPHNLNGHPGAVYKFIVPAKVKETKGESPQVKWQNEFHTLINDKFIQSQSICKYMYEITTFYEQNVLHDKTPYFNLTQQPYYLSNGTQTNNYNQMQFFQQNKLKDPHDNMLIWFRDILNQVELDQLQHNDKLIYTYEEQKIFPVLRNVEKANDIINILSRTT